MQLGMFVGDLRVKVQCWHEVTGIKSPAHLLREELETQNPKSAAATSFFRFPALPSSTPASNPHSPHPTLTLNLRRLPQIPTGVQQPSDELSPAVFRRICFSVSLSPLRSPYSRVVYTAKNWISFAASLLLQLSGSSPTISGSPSFFRSAVFRRPERARTATILPSNLVSLLADYYLRVIGLLGPELVSPFPPSLLLSGAEN